MLKLGTSEKNISPETGVELCGYAARVQPSTGKYDDLSARILYLENGGRKLLWIHCDLIGFDNEIAWEIRRAAAEKASLEVRDVFLSATHTHSGPATVFLRQCGEISRDYIRFLVAAIADGAQEATGGLEEVMLCYSETTLDGIAIDRRRPSGNSHVDTTLPVLGFKRNDGSFKAVIANYGMHNVGLDHNNRNVSADIAGFAARLAGAKIKGNPLVLMTNGGCGNINPTAKSADYSEVEKRGTALGEAVVREIADAPNCAGDGISVSFAELALPLEPLTAGGLEEAMAIHREQYRNSDKGYIQSRVFEAYRLWHDETKKIIEKREEPMPAAAYLHVLKLGPVIFAGINAEVFSVMAERLRRAAGERRLYVVSYADGCVGYLAPREIYAEGGYEVDGAHKFYSHFRLAAGGFEMIERKIAEMI